eukprot:5173283-Alexandrium_andersonii.AAC.1
MVASSRGSTSASFKSLAGGSCPSERFCFDGITAGSSCTILPAPANIFATGVPGAGAAGAASVGGA